MSRTLFWYVLRDLLKIFLMTSGVLAGIMSFGGLLKPLTQYGLSGTQVAQMLAYFMPAAQTYSLPIAALFATTVVYGRLAADNELTACRATGISYLAMTLPAFVLGLTLAIVSLLSLCFIVPHYTLKVEKIAFASLAEVVQKNIERTHQIKLEDYTIFAESAEVKEPPPEAPGDEMVVLHDVFICVWKADERTKALVPSEFYSASSATALIRQVDDLITFSASLADGTTFSRTFAGRGVGGVRTGQFGPRLIESPIKENTKFMDIRQLNAMLGQPMLSRQIRNLHQRITQQEQEQEYINLLGRLLVEKREHRFERNGEAYTILLPPRVKPARSGSKLTVSAADMGRPVRLRYEKEGDVQTDEARGLSLRVSADGSEGRMLLEFELEDVQGIGRKRFRRPFSVSMPEAVAQLAQRGPMHYVNDPAKAHPKSPEGQLKRRLPKLQSSIMAEIHGRISFAVSCLILVMMGCALGMMFRTGNYLSAFAISVAPALLCLALVITGQHVSESSPRSLGLGLGLIWSGNVMVFALATGLLGHLKKQ